jgi:hypothetical protein
MSNKIKILWRMLKNLPYKWEALSTLPAISLAFWVAFYAMEWTGERGVKGAFAFEMVIKSLTFIVFSVVFWILSAIVFLLILGGSVWVYDLVRKAWKKAEGQIQEESGS